MAIHYEELAQKIMEVEKFHDLSASQRPRRASGVILVLNSKALEPGERMV